MTIGLLFWILVIFAVIGDFWLSRPAAPPGARLYSWVLHLILILLLGWQVFGPALHR